MLLHSKHVSSLVLCVHPIAHPWVLDETMSSRVYARVWSIKLLQMEAAICFRLAQRAVGNARYWLKQEKGVDDVRNEVKTTKDKNIFILPYFG